MPRPQPPVPGRYAWRHLDYPHKPTLVFPAHFVLTRAHLEATSQSVTHPQIAPSQACLTLEFFEDVLPEKKVHLVDMSSLSFLLSQDVTYTPTQRNRCPHRPTRTFPLGTRLCVQCQHMSHMFAQLTRTRPCNREGRL